MTLDKQDIQYFQAYQHPDKFGDLIGYRVTAFDRGATAGTGRISAFGTGCNSDANDVGYCSTLAEARAASIAMRLHGRNFRIW